MSSLILYKDRSHCNRYFWIIIHRLDLSSMGKMARLDQHTTDGILDILRLVLVIQTLQYCLSCMCVAESHNQGLWYVLKLPNNAKLREFCLKNVCNSREFVVVLKVEYCFCCVFQITWHVFEKHEKSILE